MHAANLLQWEKLRKTGALPHLARWYDYVMTDPVLQSVAEQHGPKKPTTRKEYVKVVAAAGMGGGGMPHPGAFASSLPGVLIGCPKNPAWHALSLDPEGVNAEQKCLGILCSEVPYLPSPGIC